MFRMQCRDRHHELIDGHLNRQEFIAKFRDIVGGFVDTPGIADQPITHRRGLQHRPRSHEIVQLPRVHLGDGLGVEQTRASRGSRYQPPPLTSSPTAIMRYRHGRIITLPFASMPWTWNTDLAISRPIVVTACRSLAAVIEERHGARRRTYAARGEGGKSPAEAGLESGQVKCGALGEVLTRLAGDRITLSPKNSQLPASHLLATSDDQPSLELSGFLQGDVPAHGNSREWCSPRSARP